ncbi:hypothetical protein DSO57_1011565 [Entomophthora muscae]|uniref:Uncharacterized protein n=1 Tax=Entomophthora muscae TaxID=34485 RepID=A0ACC2SVE7_9FUNG|nr:hypothetical protein DSO57_1011565 [Entomophthora muscae]
MLAASKQQKYEVDFWDEFVPNNINVDIYTCTWQPIGIKPKANVVFIHGQAEHVRRYDHVFQELAKSGFKVQGFDQVGCGRTGQRAKDLGGALGLSRVLIEVDDCIDRMYDPDIPLFLMGHSFGGASTLNYLAMGERRDLVYGAIASAPCIRIAEESQPFFVKRWVGLTAAVVFPLQKIDTSMEPSYLTRDKGEVEKTLKDPYRFSKTSLIQSRDLLKEGENFMNFRTGNVKTPRLLIMHGTADKLASYDASANTYLKLKRQSRIPNLEFKAYEGGYHERKSIFISLVNFLFSGP